MAAILITNIQKWVGTAAERVALSTTNTTAGSTFEETDTGLIYKWSGAAWFINTDETLTLAAGTALVGKVGIDQATTHANEVVTIAGSVNASTLQINNTDVSTTNPVNITSNASRVSDSQTRLANSTAYTANDVRGDNTVLTFASVANTAANFIITNVQLEIDIAAVPSGMSSFRLHLYEVTPTAINDNVAYNLPSGDRAKYIGYIDIDTPEDIGDTLYICMTNINFQGKLAAGSTSLYGMLQTIGAYTPTSEAVAKVTLSVLEV